MRVKIEHGKKVLRVFIDEKLFKDKVFDRPKTYMFKFKTTEHWYFKHSITPVNSVYELMEYFTEHQESGILTVVILEFKEV